MSLRWSSFDRIVVTRATSKLGPDDLDALANILSSVHARLGKRLLLVQVSTVSGGVSVHYAGRGSTTAFSRYAAAVREHVEQVHAVTAGGGVWGEVLRGLVSTVTRFGPNPTVLHGDVGAMIEYLRARHGVDPGLLREHIQRLQ